MFLSRPAQFSGKTPFPAIDDSQPSVDQRLEDAFIESAPVYEPIARAFHGLMWSWFTLYFACASAGGGAISAAFTFLVSLPPEPDCTDLPQDASMPDDVTCMRAIATNSVDILASGIAGVSHRLPTEPLFSEQHPSIQHWSSPAFYKTPTAATGGYFSPTEHRFNHSSQPSLLATHSIRPEISWPIDAFAASTL